MADLPPLPRGARLVGSAPRKPVRDPDLFKPLLDSGVQATNGFRTPVDTQRIRAQGYKPAAGGAHEHGDGLDLTPGTSGLSMKQLEARARRIAEANGGRVINEGHHIHAQIPGWGMAPGTPGTPNSGLPPLPKGAKLTQRGSLTGGNYDPRLGRPTGKVSDGDTFGLSTGGNARLYGVDAFELNQRGQAPGGAMVPLGQQARNALIPFAQPNAAVMAAGAPSYGRPVVSLNNGRDAGEAMIRQGLGLAAPNYLEGNALLGPYMEAERLARLNRQGAHGLTFQTPQSHRQGNPDPWAAPEASTDGKGVAFFADEPTPFQGLRPDIAEGWLALHNDRISTAADFEAYAKANGFDFDRGENARFIKERAANPERDIEQAVNYMDSARVLHDAGGDALGAGARGFADPFNLLDEMGAVVDTLGGTDGRENLWNSERRFGDVLANNLEQNRSILGHDDAYHPVARLGGQLLSSVAMPYGAGVRTPMALGKLGAAEGALAGFGAGEGWQDRAIGAGVGSALGGAAGATLGRVGNEIAESRVGQRIANAISEKLGGKPMPDPEALRQGAYEAAPIVNDATQTAGPTPAARNQPPGGVANMAMDDMGSVMFGPRVPDRINVDDLPPLPPGATLLDPVGGIRPIGEPLDAATMARLFKGADPEALLPRPGNVVANMDEAIAANPGSFERVTAPDEFSALGVRRLPSTRDLYKTQSVRGPLDMTQALRRLGGVRDDGGNLVHLGIGEPRKLPFGGGEQFLGRLVNNDTGMDLDEAAFKLWEMGYFPEFRDRPMVDDLIERLHAELTGAQRFFHPDDAEEVANFERAQSQRYALEEAEAERGPIYERVGSELSFDDLVANTPPASAYEEMPSLTGRVGNISLDKIERPQDVAQILDYVAAKVGGFDAASRGRVTNEETARLAADMGLTPEQLLKRRPGQALNAEQAFAARTILRGSLEQVGKLAKKAVGGSDADKLALEKALLKHAAIQEQVSGATAEAGRALQQFKMVAGIEKAQAKAIREFLKGAKEDDLEDAASAIIDLMEDPAKANRFIADAAKPGLKNKLVELYYNSLLSGPQTHAVNIVSNAMTAGLSIPEHIVAMTLGQVRRGFAQVGRVKNLRADRNGVKFSLGASPEVDRIMLSELGPRITGLMQGAMDGLRAARYTFKTGRVPDLVSKVEAAQQEAIGGKVGHVLRTPTRALAAEDEFFKAVARRSELASLAYRQARKEGLRGDALNERAAALVNNPPEEMLQQALDFARYQTFQRPVGDIAGGLMRVANRHPYLKLVVPFIRTPTNILKYSAERSPLAPLLKDWRADFLAGGARRDLAIARATMGTGLGLAVMQAAHDGMITGGGPLDENARGILRADGWQPYSIRMGDKWVSYQRLDPLAMTLGIAADYVEKQSAMTERQRDQLAMQMIASVIQNLSDKTWLSGMSETLSAIQDPVRYGPGAIRRTVAGAVTPAIVGQTARTIDATPREQKTVGEAIQARVPGLSDDLRPSLDAWGQSYTKEGGIGPDILSPFYQSTRRRKAINEEALRLGLKVSDPSRMVGGERLSDEDFHAYRQKAGGLTQQAFRLLVESPEWKAMTPEAQQKAFAKIKKESRKAAREELFGGGGDDEPEAPAAVPPLPKGATLPPLPPGARMIKQ